MCFREIITKMTSYLPYVELWNSVLIFTGDILHFIKSETLDHISNIYDVYCNVNVNMWNLKRLLLFIKKIMTPIFPHTHRLQTML